MDGNRKRFSFGWYTGVILGIAASGAAVYAVTLPHTFTDGTTASAAQVNANFQALKDAIDGCTTDMVRVGSTCLDKEALVITDATGCQPTGQGCAGIKTASVTTAGASGVQFSWGQATAACTNAGKRLATGREILVAHHGGAIDVSKDGGASALYVDAAVARQAGALYAGTHMSLSPGGFELLGVNTNYTDQFPSAGTNQPNTVAFRCAR